MKSGIVGVVAVLLALAPRLARADEEWPPGTWSPDPWREHDDRPPRPPARPLPPPPPRPRPMAAPGLPRPPSRPFLMEGGVGPTMFAVLGAHSTARELGGAFQLGLHLPLGAHFGVGFRFGWGLTSWKRTERFAHAGYVVADKTTQLLGELWGEIAMHERFDEKVGIAAADVLVTILSVIPYAIAGVIYVVSPIAATSSIETATTFEAWPGRDPSRTPFAGVGASAMLYVLPDTGRAFGGIGPTASVGYRFDKIALGLVGTFLPSGGHGRDSRAPNAHVITSTLTLSVIR